MKKDRNAPASTLSMWKPAICSLLILPSVAIAQEATPDDSEIIDLSPFEVSASDSEGYQVTNVLSATRLAVPIEDVPLSISVATRELLDDTGVTQIEDAFAYMPGVFSSSNNGRVGTATIRGFNAPYLLRDGFRRFRASPTATIERVEFVRGPNAVLYGQGEPGGIINYITKQAFDNQATNLKFSVGSDGFYNFLVDHNQPVTDDFSIRLVGDVLVEDGWRRNQERDERTLFLAGKWDITDRTKLTFSVENYRDRGDEVQWLPNTWPVTTGAGIIFPLGDGSWSVNQPEHYSHNDVEGYNLALFHSLSDEWTLRAAGSFSNPEFELYRNTQSLALDSAGGRGTAGQPAITPDRVEIRRENYRILENDVLSLQLELAGEFDTGSVSHRLLVGAEYFDDESEQETFRFQAPGGSPFATFLFNDPSTWNYTPVPFTRDNPNFRRIAPTGGTKSEFEYLYLSHTAGFFDDRIHTLFGVRYNSENGEARTLSGANDATEFGPWEESTDLTETTFQYGINAEITKQINAYASYGESFNPQGGLDLNNNPFPPLQGEGLDIGLKTTFMDGRVMFNVSYFDITQENLPITLTDINGQSLGRIAAGSTSSTGYELELNAQLTDSWSLLASYTNMDAQFDQDADPNNANDPEAGQSLPNAPEHMFSLWTRYDVRSGPLDGVYFGGGVRYVSETELVTRPDFIANGFTRDSYEVVDLLLGYETDKWFGKSSSVQLNIFNATDETYVEYGRVPGDELNARLTFQVDF